MICRYCNDRGCLCCAGEKQRHFNRLYPDGKVEPVFVAQIDDPGVMALLKEHFGAEHVTKLVEEAAGDPVKLAMLMSINAAIARDRQRVAKEKAQTDGD